MANARMPLHWIVRLMVSLGLPLFTGMMALSHYQRDATIHVLETTGIVDEIHLKNHNSVTSHYTVNGMTYHLNIGGGHDGIQVYDHIVIYYDAGDPDNAAYDRASLSPYRFVPEFVLALCLGALMYFFLWILDYGSRLPSHPLPNRPRNIIGKN